MHTFSKSFQTLLWIMLRGHSRPGVIFPLVFFFFFLGAFDQYKYSEISSFEERSSSSRQLYPPNCERWSQLLLIILTQFSGGLVDSSTRQLGGKPLVSFPYDIWDVLVGCFLSSHMYQYLPLEVYQVFLIPPLIRMGNCNILW